MFYTEFVHQKKNKGESVSKYRTIFPRMVFLGTLFRYLKSYRIFLTLLKEWKLRTFILHPIKILNENKTKISELHLPQPVSAQW